MQIQADYDAISSLAVSPQGRKVLWLLKDHGEAFCFLDHENQDAAVELVRSLVSRWAETSELLQHVSCMCRTDLPLVVNVEGVQGGNSAPVSGDVTAHLAGG